MLTSRTAWSGAESRRTAAHIASGTAISTESTAL